MLVLEAIILYCLQQIKRERTVYSIFHLFNGKKSSQTIQDAHLFSLKRFFAIYETLTRDSFDEIINQMLQNKWIEHCGEQRYIVTPTGQIILEEYPIPANLHGWRYHLVAPQFWERLSLFIQVASNLAFGESRYLPIQKNKEVHLWLKSAIKEIQLPKEELGKRVFEELVECLDGIDEINPDLLVFRLTGYQQIGLTLQQTGQKLKLNIHDSQIGFVLCLHYLLQQISLNPNQFRILALLIKDLKQENELTISARKSWKLFEQGHSIERIAAIRQLKISTIEDHLVEFALHVGQFSIDPFVHHDLQTKILDISQHAGTKQLKLIKDKLDKVSYFQIRLVLAKYGDRQWN